MTTFILPGFSFKNKDWAEKVQKNLTLQFPVKIIYWAHWKSGKPEKNWIEKEAEKIVRNIRSNEQINILAKSIGTAVAMVVLKSNPKLINRIILCGIPLLDFKEGDEKLNYPEHGGSGILRFSESLC